MAGAGTSLDPDASSDHDTPKEPDPPSSFVAEVDAAAVAGAGARTLVDPEDSSDHETPKDPDASSSLVDDPEGMPVSVRSSSDWEAVTTLDATFLGVALAARATRDGVEVPGGTYSGSRSSSEQITRQQTGRQTSIASVHRLGLVWVP